MNYYELLGLTKTANERDIKTAYKKLAIKYHPDHNPNNKEKEEQFKELQKAYEILINPITRRQYDNELDNRLNFNVNDFTTINTNNQDFFFGDLNISVSDLFHNLRNQYNNNYNTESLHLNTTIEITLLEASHGCIKTISVNTKNSCNKCNGTGLDSVSIKDCNICQGQGIKTVYSQHGNNLFWEYTTCSECFGRGKIANKSCDNCLGKKLFNKIETRIIDIPSGIDNNEIIIKQNEGKRIGNLVGNLYVTIKIKPHDIFTRKRNHLYCQVPINITTAALGGTIDVPSLSSTSTIKLYIPAGTQTGKVFLIKNQGISLLNKKNKGNLFCKVIVETPINLNAKQISLLKELSLTVNNAIKKHKQ